jgi:predicted translin family RNA/ssDNA-binding protein
MANHMNPLLQWFYEDMDESGNEHQRAMMVGRDITMLCNWDYYCAHKGWMG